MEIRRRSEKSNVDYVLMNREHRKDTLDISVKRFGEKRSENLRQKL